MCPMPLGLKPLTLVMKNKENMYFETRSARNTASLLNPLNLFMGIPSAFCLRTSAFLISKPGILFKVYENFNISIDITK
jgi:hypothetical protein